MWALFRVVKFFQPTTCDVLYDSVYLGVRRGGVRLYLRLRSVLDFSPVYGPTSLLPHFPSTGLPVTRSWR